MAAALPAKVTITAMVRMTGKSTGWIGDLRSEDGVADLAGQERASGKAYGASQQGQQRSLGKKQDGHCQIAGAQSLHQANFAATLKHRGRHGGGNRQRRGQQRRQRDQEHQSLDARKHRAFILRHLADLLGVGVRNGLLQLECDGLRIRRAVPAVVHLRRHAFGIAAGKGIFGFGHGADVDAADRAGLAENLLRQRERSDDLIIFGAAGRENAGNPARLAGDFNLLTGRPVQSCGQMFAEQDVLASYRPATRPVPSTRDAWCERR